MTTDVWFIMLPGVLSLDMSGPAETFMLAKEGFRLHYIGPDPEVMTSIGITMSGIRPLPEALPEGSLLVLPGVSDSDRYFSTQQADAVRRWLARLKPQLQARELTLMCVCSGSLLAARAGLLHGVKCTTHHDVIARLKVAEPGAVVKENRIFVEDRGIWTSAGITSGIDLALHLIARLQGSGCAIAVAREMVVWFRRSGDDPQISPWLRYRNHLHPAIHRAQDALTAAPQQPWPLVAVAACAHVTPRHLTRLFRQHLGISVRHYLEQLRLALAEQRLQQGSGMEEAALGAGFSSARQLHRARSRALAHQPPPVEALHQH